jgi:hypothetical protein
VERSANGKDWKEIGFVSSKSIKGTSNEKLDYTYYDGNPISGLNYYRLRQLDIDNHEKISQVRILSIAADNTRITIFPNPIIDNVSVHGIKAGANLMLTDSRGSIIYNTSAEESDVTIPADKLMPGVYFLQITNNNALIKTVKVVKM